MYSEVCTCIQEEKRVITRFERFSRYNRYMTAKFLTGVHRFGSEVSRVWRVSVGANVFGLVAADSAVQPYAPTYGVALCAHFPACTAEGFWAYIGRNNGLTQF